MRGNRDRSETTGVTTTPGGERRRTRRGDHTEETPPGTRDIPAEITRTAGGERTQTRRTGGHTELLTPPGTESRGSPGTTTRGQSEATRTTGIRTDRADLAPELAPSLTTRTPV